MATSIDIGTLITCKPEIRGVRPIIAGTSITVERITGWHKLGRTPDEIVETYGHLSPAQVYAALAYYYANRDEIEADIAAEHAEFERVEHEYAMHQQRL